MQLPSLSGSINTFLGSGLSSSITGYLATYFDPLIAAIVWSYPLTMLFPVIQMNNSGVPHDRIRNYLKAQTYTMVLLVVWLYSTGYFVGQIKEGASIRPALLKGTACWAAAGVVYYGIMSKIRKYL